MSEKVFTLEEAQEHISWLIDEIDSIIPKRNSVRDLQRQIDDLVGRMAGNGGQNSHDRLEEFQRDLALAVSHDMNLEKYASSLALALSHDMILEELLRFIGFGLEP